ncbi:MAG: PQQ-dependent sugar dehydrogenase, partial [Microbacteriaceae bacterium]
SVRENSQDLGSLGGKILRINSDGSIPTDNPYPNSAVYSLGHRNVQGLAWTSDGRMWASEFGQNTWDELNQIQAGKNYGWPVVEGIAQNSSYIDPVIQWPTDIASPSGISAIGTDVYLASLRGSRVWRVDTQKLVQGESTLATDIPEAVSFFADSFGRIRDLHIQADGALLILTNNTDGRGRPGTDDDRLIALENISSHSSKNSR